MARTDANPPMPEFSTSYVLQEVDPKWLTQAVKPKQFLHIDQAECILCEGCVDICPRCALCVDRCPTGVIILGKVSDRWNEGDPNDRTNRHGYAYGIRF